MEMGALIGGFRIMGAARRSNVEWHLDYEVSWEGEERVRNISLGSSQIIINLSAPSNFRDILLYFGFCWRLAKS
jgi:hypothetical protein